MKAGRRYPMLVRSLASAAALAVAAQGGGAPMCVSLIAKAVEPCAMHTHGAASAHDFDVATLSPAPLGNDACHADAESLGCAAGGTCPTGGPVAPVSATPPPALRASICVAPLGIASRFHSYLAPPPSPPPQA